MKIEKLSSGGLDIRYFAFGAEEGRPLVVIPGVAVRSVMESADAVRAALSLFAHDHRVYVADRRENIDDGYNVEAMTEDIITLMDGLHLNEADIYATSQGGMIAMSAVLERPDLAASLALCSTAPVVDSHARAVFENWCRLSEAGKREELMEDFARKLFTPGYCKANLPAFLDFGKTLSQKELDRFSLIVRGMFDFDIRNELHRISCPVLAVCGSSDLIFDGKYSEEITAKADGRLSVHKDSAHALYDEDPEVLCEIKEFFQANSI
jgi:pimeloyl-ACP methyl ester carboxylesterase